MPLSHLAKKQMSSSAVVNVRLVDCSKEDASIIEAGEEKLLEDMKKMAVIRVGVSIRHTQQISMNQEPEQSIREFYANAKAQASTCEYLLKCGQTFCVEMPVIDNVI